MRSDRGYSSAGVELLIAPAVFAVLGYAVGRWWVVILAVATCVGVTVFLVVNNGWYGEGWGDFGLTGPLASRSRSRPTVGRERGPRR